MRMMETPELDPDMRSVIDAARPGHEPNELSRARVRKGVEYKLAAGIALAVGPASSAVAGVLKMTAAVVAVGTVVTAGVYVVPRYVSKPAPVRAPAAHVAAPVAPAVAPPLPVEVDIPEPSARPPRAHVRHRPPAAPAAVAVDVSSLKEELALLGAANAALARGDTKRALSLLDDYDRRPGAAQLAEERTVTGILADCASGHLDTARAEARHFRARWPRSPLAARVDGSCAGSVESARASRSAP